MQDDLFEWDDEKAKTNDEKHSISFDYAAELLIDDYVAFTPMSRERNASRL